MYELKINSHKVGVFRTLREARAYQPSWIEAMEAGIDVTTGGHFTRIISKQRKPAFNRVGDKTAKSNGAENESI